MNDALSTLYPEIEPFDSGRLAVGEPHEIYYEQYGNPNGKPALFVHGGPGGGSSRIQSRFWDPRVYRVVLFDQRGCGKSTPAASLDDNTTWHLVADMEKLRRHLGISRWQVFGGSWGSTLALAYAETHPEAVTEIVLRGIFLLRKREIDWFYQEGASRIFPDAWESYLAPIPEAERGDLLHAYHRRLTGNDAATRLRAAKAWSSWEAATSTLRPNPAMQTSMSRDEFALAFARIECHYFVNHGFFEHEGQLLAGVSRIRNIPAVIVQGRYDMVCPIETAWALHKAWPEAELRIAQSAGHSAFEPEIVHHLVEATTKLGGS
ncbi:MAG: prolyl aminopeptidase [Polyangiales bacterium]